jgi:peptide/nickel transport system substrate-binding protein
MLRGRIDMLYEVGIDAMDSLQGASNVAMFTLLRRYQYVIVFNTKSDALRDRNVRRAINFAIDRATIVSEALNGHGAPSAGPVWPANHAAAANGPSFKYNATLAAQLLSRKDRAETKPIVRFTCLVRPDTVHERIALSVKRHLQQIGVEMNIEQVSIDQLVGSMKNRQFEAVLTEMVSGPTLLRPYRMWHSGGPAGADSPVIDAALERVRHAASDAEYTQAVQGFQQAAVDDPPAIFLAWMERARAVSKRFVVPAAEPGRDVLSSLRLWKPAGEVRQASRN